MKHIKKLASLLLAVVMILALATTAFAAPPTSQTFADGNAADTDGKYTISVASTDTHTYTVYQILTGTLVAGESKLGNPAWGSDANATTTYETVDAFITAITASGLSNQQINAIAESVLKSSASGVGQVSKDNSLNVVPGYYLIKDTTASLDDGDAKSLNIVAVFNDIQITPKKGTVTSEKHVDDQNDSDSSDYSKLKDSADYDIGDSIPYTLTMTLPDDYANYKQYKIVFTDDMSKGLTLNADSVKIHYGASDTAGTTITFTEGTGSSYTGGKVYTYTITDLKAAQATQDASAALKALGAGSVISITYTATLNSNAVVGSDGNPNKFKVDYSSNPNQDANGTPETNDTPWDTNIVFTYKTVFNKVDASGNPLTGADFTLYKFVEDQNGTDTYETKKGTWTDVTSLHTGAGAANPTKTKESYTVGAGTDAKTAENAKFTFAGLDAGIYKLVESTTPTGYNTIADQIFTITATHDLESADPKLTALTGTDGNEFTMTAVQQGEEGSKTPTGELDANIRNNQGSVLPTTGGIGTTIFYVTGAVLALGAGILLITKRRMSR